MKGVVGNSGQNDADHAKSDGNQAKGTIDGLFHRNSQ